MSKEIIKGKDGAEFEKEILPDGTETVTLIKPVKKKEAPVKSKESKKKVTDDEKL